MNQNKYGTHADTHFRMLLKLITSMKTALQIIVIVFPIIQIYTLTIIVEVLILHQLRCIIIYVHLSVPLFVCVCFCT